MTNDLPPNRLWNENCCKIIIQKISIKILVLKEKKSYSLIVKKLYNDQTANLCHLNVKSADADV